MPTLVNCPSCQRKLKVPEDLLGKNVKCPGCGKTFLAEEQEALPPPPPRAATPRPKASDRESFRADDEDEPPRKAKARSESPRRRDEDDDYQEDEPRPKRRPPRDEEDYDDDDRPRRRRRSGGGAARQMVAGPAIALMVTGIICVLLAVCSLGLNIATMAGAAIIPQAGAANQPAWMSVFSGGIGAAFNVVGLGISVFIIFASQKMKNLESHGLAMAASIIAMIPCISPCCILGLPFGIWSIVVLNNPEVKSAFR